MQVNCALEILCYTCSIVDDIATIAPGKASQGHFKTPFKICEALENAKHSNLGFACGKKRLFHSQTNLCQQNSPSEEDFNGTRDGPYYHRQGRNQTETCSKFKKKWHEIARFVDIANQFYNYRKTFSRGLWLNQNDFKFETFWMKV